MDKADIFLTFCLFYLGGIFFASFFIVDYFFFIIISLITGLAFMGLFYKKILFIYGLGFLFFSLGIFLFETSLANIYKAPVLNFAEENAIIIGKVARDSEGFEKEKLVVEISSIDNLKQDWGKILIFNEKYSIIKMGDVLEISGVIKKPENFSNFDYRGYLAKEGISAIMVNPDIKIIKKGNNNFFISSIDFIKTKISAAMEADFIPSQTPIAQAMILGESEKMPDELKQELAKSGISHAIAISGSHFILIASFLLSVFLFLGFWKKQSLILVLILISGYIFLIFFPASSVRAGIMIGLIYLAKMFDRQAQDWRMLVFAAFLMCLQNPLVLKYDLGFQLSFLAVAGLIFLSPIIDKFLARFLKEKMNYFRELLSATLSAQIFVLPILFFTAQYFSIFSILANILIIPIMPICLALGFIYCFLFFIPFVHNLIVILLYPFISFLLLIAKIFSSAPAINFSFPFYLVIVSYILIGVFVFKKRKKFLL